MTDKYLLPCTCGERVAVEPAQAGERVRCGCGTELEVPTLLGLRRLQPAEVPAGQAPVRRRAWGARQRLLVLGAIVTIAGIGFGTWCLLTRLSLNVSAFPPDVAVAFWESWKEGVDSPPTMIEKFIAKDTEWRNHWMIVSWSAAVLGILTMIASLTIVPARREETGTRP